jgi:hypothetical protein
MLDSKVERGDWFATPTMAWAARWKQYSTMYSEIDRQTRSKSVKVPETSSTRVEISQGSRNLVDPGMEAEFVEIGAWNAVPDENDHLSALRD